MSEELKHPAIDCRAFDYAGDCEHMTALRDQQMKKPSPLLRDFILGYLAWARQMENLDRCKFCPTCGMNVEKLGKVVAEIDAILKENGAK